MKSKSVRNNANYWYYILSMLLLVLIILLSYIIYILKKTKLPPITSNTNENQIIKERIIIRKEESELPPVYPKELPKYNNTSYQQIGILTANEEDKEPIILPLFSKKIENRNDRWNYYTATDKNNMMRLPIKYDNQKCDDDIGCREIYDGDKIYIEIYEGREFTATIYKIEAPKYFSDKY